MRYYHGGIEHITFTNLSEVPSYIIPSIWVKPTFLDTVEQKHPELREIINHYRNITYPLAFDPIASIDEVQTTTKDKFIKAPIILRRNESFYGKTNKELIFQFLNQIASNLHIKVTETELDTGYADIHGHKHNRSTGI
ncbi:hypothetical protein [Secundilactobacillus oryzae]|uniref:hypothetical protein n=1 Tax=Secundilactobacillus oryzae TaxID=1202668 RepID=UPI0006CFC55E|nr:hypothetical protein [Secundilactobacillus oryzae]